MAPLPWQVMVFPGLSPSREAFLTAAEFGTPELGGPAQLRLQVYRAMRGTGGTPSWQWDLGGSSSLSALWCLLVPCPLDWSPASRWTVGSTEMPTHVGDPKDGFGGELAGAGDSPGSVSWPGVGRVRGVMVGAGYTAWRDLML